MVRLWSILCLTVFIGGMHPVVESSAQYFMMQSELVGELTPDFTLNTINRDNINFSDFRDGQKAIVFFWATWCPHCHAELVSLKNQRETLEKRGIKVVLVNLGESRKQVAKFVSKKQIELEVFLDEEGVLEDAYQIIGLPTFYFINEEGVITASRHRLPEDVDTLLTRN